MKTFHVILGGLLVAGFFAFSGCEPQIPVELPAIPLASVEPYFSEAAEIEAIDTSYYQVKDAEGNLLGTVLFSMPYSASVNGYNGTTPLLITLDAENHITNVVLSVSRRTGFINHGTASAWTRLWPRTWMPSAVPPTPPLA